MLKNDQNEINSRNTVAQGKPLSRIRWKYREKVPVEEKYRPFLWDYPDGLAPLEIYLLRILTYGRFEDIQETFQKFPKQTYDIIQRYPQIHRGVKFWIRYWFESNLR